MLRMGPAATQDRTIPASPERAPSLALPLLTAAVLWVVIFAWQPLNFWLLMSFSVSSLAALALRLRPGMLDRPPTAREVVQGIALAAVLYGVFWLGDRVAAAVFSFAPQQVGAIYDLRHGGNPAVIAALLLLVIGPGEEIFWRGLVQRTWMERFGPVGGWLLTSAVYGLIHVMSANIMLVLAALVAGLLWGYAYLRMRALWPLIVSHALWNVAVLILWPIRGA